MAQQPIYHRNPNTKYRECYEELSYYRGFFCEREMVMGDVEKDLSEFYTLLNAFRWDILIESVPQYNIEVICEFYANLPTVD